MGWSADQSEAGFAEAQLAAYGIRPFGFTGSCAIAWREHAAVRVLGVVGLVCGWAPDSAQGTACRELARRGVCVCVCVCVVWCMMLLRAHQPAWRGRAC